MTFRGLLLRWKALAWKQAREDGRALKLMQAWLGNKATVENTFPVLKHYMSAGDGEADSVNGDDPLAGCRQMMSASGFGGVLDK